LNGAFRVYVYTPKMSFLLLVMTLFAAPTPAAGPNAKAMLEKIQKYYDATKDLHAKFEQTLESGMGGKAKKASGDVWLKKPGKMRWDYAKPEKKLMVADGTTLWVYEEEDQQAIKQDMRSSTLPTQVSFLVGEGKLTNDFDATMEKSEADAVTLKLVPKVGTTAYRYLNFVVDPKSGMVKQTIIFDQQGGKNTLTFTDVEQNKGVVDGKFTFSPPAGTRIIAPPKGPAASPPPPSSPPPGSGAGSNAPPPKQSPAAKPPTAP
jgi:outer membrane lipoprotein carrier protein